MHLHLMHVKRLLDALFRLSGRLTIHCLLDYLFDIFKREMDDVQKPGLV